MQQSVAKVSVQQRVKLQNATATLRLNTDYYGQFLFFFGLIFPIQS